MNRRWTKKASILALCLLTFAAFMSTASATDGSGYEITLVGHTYDRVTSVSTWTYNVRVANNAPHGLGYWIIAWCGGDSSIAGAGPGSWEYRSPDKPDPNTGQYGIKFASGVEKGATVQFWFQLYGNYVEGTVSVAIKAGKDIYSETTIGPVFTYTFDLTILYDTPNKMLARAYTDCPTITNVVFGWYGPFPSGETPTDDPKYLRPELTMSFVAPGPYGNGTYVQEVTLTSDYTGSWYVKADFQGGYQPRMLDDTLLNVHAPWFTSLPLVLLVTVALLAFLRRKGSTSACTVEIKEGS